MSNLTSSSTSPVPRERSAQPSHTHTHTHGHNIMRYCGMFTVQFLLLLLLLFVTLTQHTHVQAVALPPISKWPCQPGFSLSTWLRLENPFDSQRDYYKPVVYWYVMRKIDCCVYKIDIYCVYKIDRCVKPCVYLTASLQCIYVE